MSDMRIMAKVNELGLHLELDSKTPGDGACFFWAVLQQLRRMEIYPLLRPELKELADTNEQLSELTCQNQAIAGAKRKLESEMQTLHVSNPYTLSLMYN